MVSVLTIQRGGGYRVSPPVPLDNYTLPQGGLNVNTFFAIFSNFFLAGIASYSQLYSDHKYPLFRILMGLQAIFIMTKGNYTPSRKRRQNAFILEMTSGSLRHDAMRPPALCDAVSGTTQSSFQY